MGSSGGDDAGGAAVSDLTHPVPIEPELDLHAFSPRDIPAVVEEYVRAAHDAGLREVRLVHGRGRGVQRAVVQTALDRDPLVVEFWDDADSHLGATMARLANGD
jgi:DNA-nicking Smr family endonuclease